MKTLNGRGFAMTLLLIAGCHGGGSGTAGDTGAPGGRGATGGGTGGNSAGSTGGTGGTGSSDTGGTGDTGDTGTTGAGGMAGTGGGSVSSAGAADAGTGWLTPPPLPPALVVPLGATVKLHAHAVGAQIYTCTAASGANGGATIYTWVFKAPDAKLYDANGVQMGTHGAGPSWSSSDGSTAKGTKLTELPSPLPDAISWLLLRATSVAGAGVFDDVTYVQRLSTNGGQAPATGCDATAVGMDLHVGYTAEYYFYSGGAGAAWLTPPTGLPSAIALPMGLTLKLHARGIGMQIYACLANGGGGSGDGGVDAAPASYVWVYQAPDATLFDEHYSPVASLGRGPTWTWSDGSTLTAKLLAEVDSPLPDAFPWLLLKELASEGSGVLDDVGIVQQLNTAGGRAPATGCGPTNVNTLGRVAYSADYYFYVASDHADGGAAD